MNIEFRPFITFPNITFFQQNLFISTQFLPISKLIKILIYKTKLPQEKTNK